MIVSPAGSAQHRTHSRLSTVTMKPSCSMAASDSRTKLTLKTGVGEGSIFSRLWDSPVGRQPPWSGHAVETTDPEALPWDSGRRAANAPHPCRPSRS